MISAKSAALRFFTQHNLRPDPLIAPLQQGLLLSLAKIAMLPKFDRTPCQSVARFQWLASKLLVEEGLISELAVRVHAVLRNAANFDPAELLVDLLGTAAAFGIECLECFGQHKFGFKTRKTS